VSVLTLPDPAGRDQLQFDSLLWPAGIDWPEGQIELLTEITKADANALLRHWSHPLGSWRRPFGAQYFGLAIEGRAAAIAISGSTVGATSAGYKRLQVVELGRIARAPEHPGIMRVMLRLWRDYLAQRWAEQYWPVQAAVSYALPGKEGNLYRFDGWEFYGHCKPWTYDGGYSNPSVANTLADARKKLYRYIYPPAATPAA
jgi:hypothetical protein